jgi:hypothetical protein
MRDKHRSIFKQFSSTFPVQTVRRWEEIVSEWKVDKSKPNPYKEPASCTCLLFLFYSLLTTRGFSYYTSRCPTRASQG